MLVELRVENYAVIDNVAVEFAPGLNLLTGETGAGKSILIDALGLVLGEKASTEAIRHGADKAVVSAVFDLENKRAAALLEEHGIDFDSGELIVRREVAAGGKGRVFLNNQPATVALLRELATYLAAVHAQNETLVAFDGAARLELLDRFAGADLAPIAEAFAVWKKIRDHIAELERNEQDRLRMVDLWSFQAKEIADARLEPGEDERLESEKRVLANAERIHTAAMTAYDALYDGPASAATQLRAALRQLEDLASFDARFQESIAALEPARITVEDVGVTVRDYAGGIDASPERLAEIEDRLALLDRLKRKYGASVADVIAFGEEAARKLAEIENRDDTLRRLREEQKAAGAAYLAIARKLSRQRAEAAKKLEKEVEASVNDLAMKATFRIELTSSEAEADWSASGMDQARFLITTNPGEPMRPVEQIASGGELSRVILSLKAAIEAGASRRVAGREQRTLVFDEIDTGIGGRAAEAVGKKLKTLARSHQVLCVTHLPQIACFADQHYVIEKREAGGRTRTRIVRLEDEQRREEIARMLSGAKLSETSRKHAEQMLKANA